MKQTVTLIIFLLFAPNGFAQKIYFTDTSNKWIYTHITDPTPPFSVYTESHWFVGDTLYNGVLYKKFNSGVMVREDTTIHKVFVKTSVGESVLFDYNLKLNDTVAFTSGLSTIHSVVVHVDSSLRNNIWYRSWSFQPYDMYGMLYGYTVTEGMGCSYNMFHTLFPAAGEPTSGLCSFVNNSVYIAGNASCLTAAVNEEESKKQQVQILPTPADSKATMRFAQPILWGVLSIYDALGRQVQHIDIARRSSIPIGVYITAPGQYFYRIIDESKRQSYTGKFIFE